jgi:DNA-directed RNA polymerase subunit K/omega
MKLWNPSRKPLPEMGGVFSQVQGTARGITRQQLLDQSVQPRTFINSLFGKMIAELTPLDFLQLSHPQKCSTFVFMMANTIQKLFNDLRIQPVRGKDTGVVFFQKVTKLQEASGESRRLCLQIAYFYVRIFQIFGALAITVLDDPGAGAVLGAVPYAPPPVPQGYKFGAPQRIPGQRGTYLQRGGALSTEGDFRYDSDAIQFRGLATLFEEPYEDPTSRRKRFDFAETSEDLGLVPGRRSTLNGKGQNLKYRLADGTQMYANLSAAKKGGREYVSEYTLTVSNYAIGTETSIVNKAISKHADKFDIAYNNEARAWYVTRGGSQMVTDKLVGLFKRIDVAAGEIEAGKAPEQIAVLKPEGRILRTEYDSVLGRVRDARLGDGAGVGIALRSDVGVTQALQNEYLIKLLQASSSSRPVGFCVARALQLLNASAMFGPPPAALTSKICFQDHMPLVIPKAKSRLDSAASLKSADQLFYDQPSMEMGVGDARVGIDSKGSSVTVGSQADYARFLGSMMSAFGSPSAKQPVSLSQIEMKQPNCGAALVNKYLQVTDPKAIRQVIGVSQELFARQLAHTRAVIRFLSTKLLLLRRQRTPTGGSSDYVDIHPRILLGGIPVLNQVAAEARLLLENYYKGCEETYQKGVGIILASNPNAL